MTSQIRRPNHLRVLIIGAFLGFVIGGFLGFYRGFENADRVTQGEYSTNTMVGYLGVLGALVFGLLAAGVSVAIEAWSERRNR